MNRLKVWLFALLVVIAAAVTLRLHAERLRAGELAALDARLGAASAQVSAGTRALARETGAVAALAARDTRLAEALAVSEASSAAAPGARARRPAPPPASPEAADAELQDAARAALAAAERAAGFALPAGTVVTAATRAALDEKAGAGEADGEAVALLRAALQGRAEGRFARVDGALHYGAAVPAGSGAAVAVLVPVDATFLRELASGAGVDLTLSVPEVAPFSTVSGAAQGLAPWAHGAGAVAGIGRLGEVDLSVGPIALPKASSLLGELPARRARAVALDGIEGGFAVVSLSAARPLGAVVAFEWYVLAGLAAVLLAGLVAGLLVRPSAEGPAPIPEELVSAAMRIEKGDYSARAPRLAGKLGTVAAALNRAAELAGPAAAAATARPAVSDELFATGASGRSAPSSAAWETAEPSPAADPFDASPLPPAEPAPRVEPAFAAGPFAPVQAAAPAEPALAAEPFPREEAAFEAPGPVDPFREPEPPPASERSDEDEPLTAPAAARDPFAPPPFEPFAAAPPREPEGIPAGAEPLTGAPAAALLQAAAVAGAPLARESAEESHFRQVFEELLRTRAACGETTQGLSYERFRAKLEGNRTALIEKYACKTVKFQVYVKDGKAALRATPVR